MAELTPQALSTITELLGKTEGELASILEDGTIKLEWLSPEDLKQSNMDFEKASQEYTSEELLTEQGIIFMQSGDRLYDLTMNAHRIYNETHPEAKIDDAPKNVAIYKGLKGLMAYEQFSDTIMIKSEFAIANMTDNELTGVLIHELEHKAQARQDGIFNFVVDKTATPFSSLLEGDENSKIPLLTAREQYSELLQTTREQVKELNDTITRSDEREADKATQTALESEAFLKGLAKLGITQITEKELDVDILTHAVPSHGNL